MIEIKHKDTGEVLHRVNASSLCRIDLQSARLRGANLVGESINYTNLNYADLRGANLSGANLSSSNLACADLTGADLSNTVLNDVTLAEAVLRHADFTDAVFFNTNLSFAELTGAKLYGSHFNIVILAFQSSIHLASGLNFIIHNGPCALDAYTLRACIHKLPDIFLRGVGYSDGEIENLRAMYTTPIYFSCFISYARAEKEFAQRLHNDLQASNVPCWLDQEDLRGGDFWRQQINEAIRLRDKTILVCSETSLQRVNVVEEILATIADERRTGKQKLFPITIDHAVYDPGFQQRVAALLPRQQQREDWLTYVSDYHIPDFSGWKDHDTYQRCFQFLLRDLRNAAAPTE